jgi:hypothetical protein
MPAWTYTSLLSSPSAEALVTLQERYDRLLEQAVGELRQLYGERLVACAVFGSVARRTQRDGSDVDLLLVVRGLPAGRFARVDEFLPAEDHLEASLRDTNPEGQPVLLCPVFKTPEEVEAGSPLFLDMVEDARILHDPEGFLRAYLDRLGSRLRALGARRVWLGNAWYWELKPDLRPGEVFSL